MLLPTIRSFFHKEQALQPNLKRVHDSIYSENQVLMVLRFQQTFQLNVFHNIHPAQNTYDSSKIVTCIIQS